MTGILLHWPFVYKILGQLNYVNKSNEEKICAEDVLLFHFYLTS